EDDRAAVKVAPFQLQTSVPGDRVQRRHPGKGEQTAGAKHTSNLAEGPPDVLDEPESIGRERDVDARIGENGEVFDVRFNESYVEFLGFRKGPRMGELFGREVDSRDSRASCRKVRRGLATAAGDFQHLLSSDVRAEDLQLPLGRH